MAIPSPECPVCHKATALANSQRYCAACGWNVESAITAIRSSLLMMPFGMLMFAGFIAFMISRWHFRNKYQIAIFCIVPVFGILVNLISMQRALGRLLALKETMPAAIAKAAVLSSGAGLGVGLRKLFDQGDVNSSVGAAGAATPTPELSGEQQALLRMSRPREIRMSSSGKFGLTAAVLMAVGFATAIGVRSYSVWVPTQSFVRFHTGDWMTVGFGLLLALLPYGIWRGQVKECDLLENGEIAIARVIRQWSSKGSSIECEYQDFTGQTRKYMGPDNTGKLLQGMTVPVFYDRDNPSRQVAYCSTLHKVVV